jgi:RHS repeat-associated protein
MVTDASGLLVGRHDFLPFGVEIPSGYGGRTTTWAASVSVTRLFTGKDRAPATENGGLDFFGARYYSADLGRFTSPDPLGNFFANPGDPQSWNLYVYARNNPLRFVDPTGHAFCSYDDGSEPWLAADGATQSVCEDNEGGLWVPDQTVQNASGDTATVETGYTQVTVNGDTGEESFLWVDPILIPESIVESSKLAPLAAEKSAPNEGTPWYHNSCITNALGAGALSIGIDSVGLIPEAGGIARMIGHEAGYVGVVADRTGNGVIRAVGASTSTALGLNGLFDPSAEGMLSTGLTIAGFIPGLGQAAAVGSIGVDSYKLAKAIRQCP